LKVSVQTKTTEKIAKDLFFFLKGKLGSELVLFGGFKNIFYVIIIK